MTFLCAFVALLAVPATFHIVTRSKFESQQTVAYMKTEKSALEMHGKGFCAKRAHMTLNMIQFHASHVNFANN